MRRIIITILFALLLIIFVVIVRKKKLKFSKLQKVITCVVFVVLYCLSYLPFESFFVRFDTPEHSLNYSQLDEKINCIVDVPNGAFLICNIGNGGSSTVVHSVEKDGDKWKMIDLHDSGELFDTGWIKSEYGITKMRDLSISGMFRYNSVINKTLIVFNAFLKSNVNITDEHGNEFAMYSTRSGTNGGYVNAYYLVLDGEPPAVITIILNNDEEIEIEL